MSNIDLMPSFEWDTDPFAQEKQELFAIQRGHDAEMRNPMSGIFDHALKSGLLTEEELYRINGLTLATVHVDTTPGQSGLPKRTFKIRLATPDLDQAGEQGELHTSYVEVAHVLPLSGMIFVINGFSEMQGLAIVAMANDLHDARNEGRTPNISDGLSSVNPQ